MNKPVVKPLFVAVDFDGTCVTHEFPRVGKDIGAVPVLKRLVDQGHKLILYTMRSDLEPAFFQKVEGIDQDIIATDGKYLFDAISWFEVNGIDLYATQMNPTQSAWTKSNKCYAHVYIDDAAMGCPLIHNKEVSDRPYVDWVEMERLLVERGILN